MLFSGTPWDGELRSHDQELQRRCTATESAQFPRGRHHRWSRAGGLWALNDAIAAAEAARPHTGRTVTAALTAGRADVDLGGIIAATLAYNNTIPGPLIRANIGDELAITVTNRLNHATSVHWHGIVLRNDMDGAAPATPNIQAGNQFTYRFSVPHPGTYWAHPHTGLDADYGLHLPVIVDDPSEPA